MNNSLQLSPSELRAKAQEIRNKVENMRSIIKQASDAVESSSESYQGRGGDQFRQAYAEAKTNFEDFYQKMEAFAAQMEKTARDYETADETIANMQKS